MMRLAPVFLLLGIASSLRFENRREGEELRPGNALLEVEQDRADILAAQRSPLDEERAVHPFDVAKALKQCGDSKKWVPVSKYLAERSVTHQVYYALNGKVASSIIRTMIHDNKTVQHAVGYNRLKKRAEFTRFSFVRDPVDRALSAFGEIMYHDDCFEWAFEKHEERLKNQPSLKNQKPAYCKTGVNPWGLDPAKKDADDEARVLARFLAMWTDLENQKFHDTHLTSQVRHTYKQPPLDFIGRFELFEEDWNELGRIQEEKHHVPWPKLIKDTKTRNTRHQLQYFITRDTLPDDVTKRICTHYKDDYCCHRLAVPDACKGLCN